MCPSPHPRTPDPAGLITTDGPVPLTLTGERTLPGIPDERYWFVRHVVAYRAAQQAVREVVRAFATARPAREVTVLDAGCGEGYGLAMLRAAGADRVIGADLDPRTVAHARAVYSAVDPAIEVVEAELRQLPVPDDAVALCVSFQVIEHLHDIPGYLAELQRVTAPGGRILIATPNRLTFTPGSDTPVNPFHTVEFTAAELTRLLTRSGLDVEVVQGVHHDGAIAAAEHDRGLAVPQLLGAGDPPTWPAWLRQLVHHVVESDFRLDTAGLDDSLDLLASCRVAAA